MIPSEKQVFHPCTPNPLSLANHLDWELSKSAFENITQTAGVYKISDSALDKVHFLFIFFKKCQKLFARPFLEKQNLPGSSTDPVNRPLHKFFKAQITKTLRS